MRNCSYSPLLLAGTVAGMALTYLVPPLLAMFGSGSRAAARRRGLGPDGARVPADPAVLPALALVGLRAARYRACSIMLFTLDSAYQYARGRGGSWKGRVQANVSEPQ